MADAKRSSRSLLCVCALTHLCAVAVAAAGISDARRTVLPNGTQVIAIPLAGVPLATVVSIVNAGSSSDPPGGSGAAHMLEHLLFNGTATRTQEALYEELAARGIVHNAHTDVDQTTLFMLGPRAEVPEMLSVQADMLFASTFPDEKLEKERGIVLNEIARDAGREESRLDTFVQEVMYRGTPCANPGAGTEASVKGLTREAILAFHRRHYVPWNTTVLVMGDVDAVEAGSAASAAFSPVRSGGGVAAAGAAPALACRVAPRAEGLVAAREEPGARRLAVAAPAPPLGTPESATASLMASLAEPGLAEAVGARLGSRSAEILDATLGYSPQKDGGLLIATATIGEGLGYEEAARALSAEIRARLTAPPREEALAGARAAERVRLALLEEKPHYFGLDRAPLIACCGWREVLAAPSQAAGVTADAIAALARPFTAESAWTTLYAGPGVPQTKAASTSASTSSPVEEESGAAPVLRKEVLPNGLTVLVRSGRESEVFAAVLLARARSESEPPGKAGIADLLHRLAGHATAHHDASALTSALTRIGAVLKVTDDPSIPYDDADTTPEFSFIRLETLDENATEALALLSEMLREPSFDPSSIERLRGIQTVRARQAGGRPSDRAKLLLLKNLLGEESPLLRSPFGTEESLASITARDLEEFRARYFSPSNLILSVSSSRPVDLSLKTIAESFGSLGGPPRSSKPAPHGKAGGAKTVREASGAPQAYVLEGKLVRLEPAEARALAAASAVLSVRMENEIREKKGLSYSLGAGLEPLAGGLLLSIRVGTKAEQVEEALRALDSVKASMTSSPPSSEEVARAVTSDGVRRLMRRLSRANQAFAAALEEIRSGGASDPWATIPSVDAAAIEGAIRRHLQGGVTRVVLD